MLYIKIQEWLPANMKLSPIIISLIFIVHTGLQIQLLSFLLKYWRVLYAKLSLATFNFEWTSLNRGETALKATQAYYEVNLTKSWR